MYGTIWALLPPVVAIVLALITKEVYSSLFIGIVTGALIYTGFSPIGTLDTIINEGFIQSVADAWNIGIFMFLVLLGTMVALMNLAGGSKAFGMGQDACKDQDRSVACYLPSGRFDLCR